MSSDFGDSSLGLGLGGKGGDKELQEFLMVEKQKAQFNAQVRNNFGFKLGYFEANTVVDLNSLIKFTKLVNLGYIGLHNKRFLVIIILISV